PLAVFVEHADGVPRHEQKRVAIRRNRGHAEESVPDALPLADQLCVIVNALRPQTICVAVDDQISVAVRRDLRGTDAPLQSDVERIEPAPVRIEACREETRARRATWNFFAPVDPHRNETAVAIRGDRRLILTAGG